jgi:hypothetical protein
MTRVIVDLEVRFRVTLTTIIFAFYTTLFSLTLNREKDINSVITMYWRPNPETSASVF